MKRMILFLTAWVAVWAVCGQGVYTKECTDRALTKKAAKWVKRGAWRNGFRAASPDESVNTVEFYEQYRRNPAQWEAMFRWLAETDLLTVPKGKYQIEGTTLTVSVEDSSNAELSKRKSESHRQHIDFQYVVRGTERFALIDHETSRPNCPYKPDVIHYDYDAAKARFFDSAPDRFFLFFPDDWHIAKIRHDGEDQHIRVIVVKLDYAE